VRMYRVGFGDCFLVTLPGPRHVLVDCGVHVAGDIGTLEEVIADIAAETGSRLDLVIASHPHEDHIGGFARGETVFRTCSIGEVWLPWTEDPTDAEAYRLRQARARLTSALSARAAAGALPGAIAALLANAAARRNDEALRLLRSGFGTGATVRFLGAGAAFDDAAGVPGLAARLLGPPRAEAFLKSMNPPRSERYLRAVEGGDAELVGACAPFGSEWVDTGGLGPRLSERERRRLVRAVASSPDQLAFALDRAINNTSLVCLFTYRGRSLLFPGDAQYGSWKSWLASPEAAALLETIDFYKVSHHGSENASPRTAVEAMVKPGLVAMASTQSVPWPSIPQEALWSALSERTGGRIVRSDQLAVASTATRSTIPVSAEFESGRLWFDYRLPV
jgi:beta-lactamase superfamily II metal-dependent hydrolase